MQFDLSDAILLLGRTPRILRAQLQDAPQRWTHANYGPDTFSPFDVVGHLIHGERTDWLSRAQHILHHGDRAPFEPFDRYAMREDSRGKSMDDLFSEFDSLRERNLEALRALNLTVAQLDLPGLHPQLGAVTMRQLLSTWVVHDLHHLAQINKAMACQYRENVGPWRAYLGILDAARPPQEHDS